MKSLLDKNGIHILPGAFERLSNFEKNAEMRSATSSDTLYKIENKIIHMHLNGSLNTDELMFIVNEQMPDGSKYMG